VPSTLYQFLIQWVSDKVEVVHGDTSACVAVVDSTNINNYENPNAKLVWIYLI
jgi:hypothetical protein